MKRTKFFAGALALVFAMSLPLVSCSNDDDNSNTEASEAEQELEATAFSVLRSLIDLAKYDPEAVKEDEDDEYIGVETLPSNWKSMTFACDQGTALSSDSTVRLIAANGIDDAKEFFASMIGEEFTSDTYAWNYAGLGSLTFTAVSGNDDLFATIDVAIDVLPDVKELRFLSEDAYDDATAELNAENSFSGVPYYSAGDVIQRTSDGTYWMCVRPAGGPLHKDKSYWICLHPFDKSGKNIIKSETKKYELYWGGDKYSQTWTYAKNLMSLKTAKAAHHTFTALTNREINYENAQAAYEALVEKGYNIAALRLDATAENKFDEVDTAGFCFAYGSPTNDKGRSTSVGNMNCQTRYVQPFIWGETSSVSAGKLIEEIYTLSNLDDAKYFKVLFSTTDDFDYKFLLSNYKGYKKPETHPGAYDYKNYLHKIKNDGLQFDLYAVGWLRQDKNAHVIFSPELCIKDNKGKTSAVNPLGSSYEVIFRQKNDLGDEKCFDWWDSLNQTKRFVNDDEVQWNKENA